MATKTENAKKTVKTAKTQSKTCFYIVSLGCPSSDYLVDVVVIRCVTCFGHRAVLEWGIAITRSPVTLSSPWTPDLPSTSLAVDLTRSWRSSASSRFSDNFSVKFSALRSTLIYCYAAVLVGHIMGLARLSICPLWAPNLKINRCRKAKIGVKIPHGSSSRCANFQLGW